MDCKFEMWKSSVVDEVINILDCSLESASSIVVANWSVLQLAYAKEAMPYRLAARLILNLEPLNKPITAYECLINGGYEFVQSAPMEDGRFEIVLSKNEKIVTLLTDEPFAHQD